MKDPDLLVVMTLPHRVFSGSPSEGTVVLNGGRFLQLPTKRLEHCYTKPDHEFYKF